MDVKQTVEAVKGLRVLAVVGAAVGEQGLEAEDIEDVLAGVKHHQAVVDGFKEAELIPAELKDIDVAEAALLWSEMARAFNDAKRALNGESAKSILG